MTRGDAKETHPFIHLGATWPVTHEPVLQHFKPAAAAGGTGPAEQRVAGIWDTLGSAISEDTGEFWAVCCTFSSGQRLTRGCEVAYNGSLFNEQLFSAPVSAQRLAPRARVETGGLSSLLRGWGCKVLRALNVLFPLQGREKGSK